MHTYTQTHYKMQHHRCSFPDCASGATTKNRKGSESKKKKRDRVHAPRTFTRKHTMCLSLNLILPRSVPCCRTRHTTSHTHLCVIAFLVSHEKKKRDSRRWLRQDKSKKKGSPPLPNKKKGEKTTRTIIKVT